MSLPSFSSDYNPTTFAEATNSNCKRLIKLSLKRRYVVAGVDTYDADWTDITSYFVSMGEVSSGIDDQESIVGIMRVSNCDIEMDNSAGKFTGRSDSRSLWYDTTTDFYVASSLVKIEVGFLTPAGTELWASSPIIDGVLRYDSITYTPNNTATMTIFSKLEYLKYRNVYEAFSFTHFPHASLQSTADNIFKWATDNAPTEFGFTRIACNPRTDVLYEDFDMYNGSMYDCMQTFAKTSGSVFGLTRNNELFFTYFGNPYTQETISAFHLDSSLVVALYHLTATAGPADLSPYGNNMTLNASYVTQTPSKTAGYFGYGGQIFNDVAPTANVMYYYKHSMAGVSKDMTFEVLCNLRARRTFYDNSGLFAFGNANSPVAEVSLTAGQNNWLINYGFSGKEDGKTRFRCDSFSHNLAGGILTGDVPVLVGENQWQYLAVVNDTVNDNRRYYINGTLVQQTTPAFTSIASGFYFGNLKLGRYSSLEVDSIRISAFPRTADQIKQANARIFGSKALASSSIAFHLYNYGSECNIVDVMRYEDGSRRVFNAVTIPRSRSAEDVYRCKFRVVHAGNPLYVSCKIGNNDNATATPMVCSTNEDVIYSFTKRALPNVYASLGASGTITVELDADYDTAYLSTIRFDKKVSGIDFLELRYNQGDEQARRTISLVKVFKVYLPPSISLATVSAGADYIAEEGQLGMTLCFRREKTQQDVTFVNTASVYEYGRISYELSEADGITSDPVQSEKLAEAILADRSQAKIRIEVSTRFMAGDPDLLDRVRVHWKPDMKINGAVGAYESAKYGVESAGTIAGAIRWTEKDFYVVGVSHVWEENTTQLVLREV